MRRPPDLPQQLKSTQALVRFGLRLVIMTGFAAFGSVGFVRSFAALLGMSTILCAVVGTIRREPPFAADLNHWDEMAAYGALCALASGLGQYS